MQVYHEIKPIVNKAGLLQAFKWKIIILAFLGNFLSGFGQSFFLSLFTPYLLVHLSLSNSSYGLIYSIATLTSGLLIPYFGSRLNYQTPKLFMMLCGLGLTVFSLSFAYVESTWHLAITLVGLRFFGQGMFIHMSSNLVATRFIGNRGRALSFANLGFPAAEAFMPVIIVWAIKDYSVTTIWQFISILLVLFIFAIPWFLRKDSIPEEEIKNAKPIEREFTGIKSITFWYFAAPAILPPFIFTSFFLYHGLILEERGLPFTLIGESFIVFALARLICSLVSGAFVDRFGAKKLFPVYLFPLTIGMFILAFWKSKLAFLSYLFLGGVSQGFASTIMTAIWVEVYGISSLAKVRSRMSSLAVLGTAMGPFVFGFATDYWNSAGSAVMLYAILQLAMLLISYVIKYFFIRN